MNKLRGSRCYLSGPMEVTGDGGAGWRQELTPFLQGLGVVVLDPCDKPIDIVVEAPVRWKRLRAEGKFDALSKEIRVLRHVDLRMVNNSDFMIVNMNNDIRTTGTWEEICLANQQKKPIVMRIAQGKRKLGLWFFGQLRHEMIFGNWSSVKAYLKAVDFDCCNSLNRWLFFDPERR